MPAIRLRVSARNGTGAPHELGVVLGRIGELDELDGDAPGLVAGGNGELPLEDALDGDVDVHQVASPSIASAGQSPGGSWTSTVMPICCWVSRDLRLSSPDPEIEQRRA